MKWKMKTSLSCMLGTLGISSLNSLYPILSETSYIEPFDLITYSLRLLFYWCTRFRSYYLFSDWLGHMHAKCHAHDQFLWQQTMISLLPAILTSATTLSRQYTFTSYHPISPSQKSVEEHQKVQGKSFVIYLKSPIKIPICFALEGLKVNKHEIFLNFFLT